MVRGSVPCDVLMVGEAPGKSEDILGQPFIGPAGDLLDDIIRQALDALEESKPRPIIAFTNLVCCIPLSQDEDEAGKKLAQPPTEAILACRERLGELIGICNPSLLVAVGSLANKWLMPMRESYARGYNKKGKICRGGEEPIPMIHILHPAAILRNLASRSLAERKCIVTLLDGMVKFLP